MLIFVLPTKKRLVISFWIFFQISRQPQRIRRKRTTKNFCWCRGIFLKQNFWITPILL